MLKELEIDAQAVSYIRQELNEGDAFAQYLLDLPLEDGRVISYLPSEVYPMGNQDFRQSIFLSTGIKIASEAKLKIQGFISAYLGKGGRSYAIFETLGRTGDAWLTTTDISYFIHDSKAYSFLTPEDSDLQSILEALRRARHYPFVCGLTSLSDDDAQIQSFQETATSVLRNLAANAEHIVIGAFDAEGYLIWSRSSSDHA